ncbi:hypothetical protein EJ02DRAFT_469504 [Clathrospora elynae]|uniref:Uncharacterized protein n=1 Tax=Clathrospora elynae TaxID=706981 RepID=A0A6A5SDG7_9PLEO|nr:hypothetical protein EJ02DRAFT_469504 [Clathrospora elynae]
MHNGMINTSVLTLQLENTCGIFASWSAGKEPGDGGYFVGPVNTSLSFPHCAGLRCSLGPADAATRQNMEPVVVEDACGVKFPVPSEYKVALLQTIIIRRFAKLRGAEDISNGNFELFYSKTPKQALASTDQLRSASSVIMYAVVSNLHPSFPVKDCCPICWADMSRATRLQDGRFE